MGARAALQDDWTTKDTKITKKKAARSAFK
jgi:hypothetical protein